MMMLRSTSAGPARDLALMRLLAQFRPIRLEQMEAVALQNRTDTKYLLRADQLARALVGLSDAYRVLEIAGTRLSGYQTLYFDTPDFALYHQHHAGKANRYKVRSRRYLATGQAFFETKLKTNKGRTVKQRTPTEGLATNCPPELCDALGAQLGTQAAALRPTLWNAFSRITLVGPGERVTIDLGLRFGSAERIVALPDIAVVEVKQDGVDRGSGFMRRLHAAHIRPTGFSKYCVGVAMLYPQVKHNRFKPRLRLIERLSGGYDNDN